MVLLLGIQQPLKVNELYKGQIWWNSEQFIMKEQAKEGFSSQYHYCRWNG